MSTRINAITQNAIRAKATISTDTEPQLGWFHRYPARFHTDVLSQMFKGVQVCLGERPKVILDPFAGTGATLSYARHLSIDSVGVELTPLGVLITRVRLEPPSDLDRALTFVEQMVCSKPNINTHPFGDELVSWIGEENAIALAHYQQIIMKVRDARLRRWVQLAVSSALRPCSVWLPGSIKPQVDPSRNFSPISNHLLRAARLLKRDCANEISSKALKATARIFYGDACHLSKKIGQVDAVITSPPYWTMYDYFDVHRLTYLAFGWHCRRDVQVGRMSRIERDGVGFVPPQSMNTWYYDEFRGEDTVEGRALRQYLVAMRKHFRSLRKTLKPEGVVAYAIANSFRKGRKFELATAVAELMIEAGFKEVTFVPRENSHRRILPAGRNMLTGRFSSSSVEAGVEEIIVYAKISGPQ